MPVSKGAEQTSLSVLPFHLLKTSSLTERRGAVQLGFMLFTKNSKHIQSHTQTHTDAHPAAQLKVFPCLSSCGTHKGLSDVSECVCLCGFVCVRTWLVGHPRWQQVAVLRGCSQRTLVVGKHGNHQGGHMTLDLDVMGGDQGTEREM